MGSNYTAEQYIDDVKNNRITVCKWVKLAVKRHLDDLKNGHKRGIWFDEDAAKHRIDFYKFCKHSKGEWAGLIFEPEPWQQFISWVIYGWKNKEGLRRFRTVYIECARKNGKTTGIATDGLYGLIADNEPGSEIYSVAALDLKTPLPTPDGWNTVGDVKIGDKLFTDNGNVCKITYMTEIFYNRKCYEIEFCDGEKIIADEQHLWKTTARRLYKGNKKSVRMPKLRCSDGRKAVFTLHNKAYYVCHWRDVDKYKKFEKKVSELLKIEPLRQAKTAIRTTKELLNTVCLEYKDGDKVKNHSIALTKSLNLPNRYLPIPPYILGIWLGDGRSNRGSFIIHPDDKEINIYIEKCGYKLSKMKNKQSLLDQTILGLRTKLMGNGLIDNKHIPNVYLRASIKQRIDLLKGVMDTDGTCTKTGECRFTNRNYNIASGVHEIVLSLGIKSHLHEISVLNKPHYIVSFKAYSDFPVFNIKRKYERQKSLPEIEYKNRKRYIRSIKQVESVPVKCIEVDSKSHLFLAGRGFIPTHNTKHEQACISHSEAKRMVMSSPNLRKRINIFNYNLNIKETASRFMPLSADSKTLDGLNIHMALIDELHAHKSRELWDVLDTATASRRQPLMFAITTAGFNKQTICWEQHEYTEKILENNLQDDTFFGIIYTLDEDDDWEDEKNWKKANPNLNISVKIDDLRRKCQKAKETPASLNAFLRLHLNKWTEAETRWMSSEKWDACAFSVDIDGLRGRTCYGGLDLSSNSDITAYVLVFPPEHEGDKYQVIPKFWIPQDNMWERVKKDRVNYDVWVRQGLITATPGNVIDYKWILNEISESMQKYDVKEIAFDRWGATKVIQDIQDMNDNEDFLVQFGQGYKSMSPPSKELETLIIGEKIAHGGNPVLSWMMSNVMMSQDPAGNIKPDKNKSTEKIDGIVALIMGLSRAFTHKERTTSIYEERGIIYV